MGPRARGRRGRVQHRRACTGRRAWRNPATGASMRSRRETWSARRRLQASGGSCTAARWACTATSSSPPADEDAPLRPGDVYQDTKVEGERLARAAAARTGIELTIARPSGIYGPGDRRLLKLFRGVARRRFVVLGDGRIFYHLTYIDDLVEGFRLCGEVAAAAGRTYILAGGEVSTLNELVSLIADEAGVPPPRLHLPVWPFWMAGAACEAVCRPLGSRAAALPAPRGLLHQEPRVPHRPRPSRAGLRAGGWPARGRPAHARVVQGAGMDVDRRMAMRAPRSGVSGRQPEGAGRRSRLRGRVA